MQRELELLSDLNQHESLRVAYSKDYFRLEITTTCPRSFSVHSFSVPIPADYPSDLQWNTPFASKQLDPAQGPYRASLYPITAGVYQILSFYNDSLQLGDQLDAIKQLLDSEDFPFSDSDSFEWLPDNESVGSEFELLERPPSSIESLDTASCSDWETSDDGAESDSTVVGEDEDILDAVMVLEPAVSSEVICQKVLEYFGLSPASAHQLTLSANQCEHRLCVELGNIKKSNMYNGSSNSMQLSILNNDIKKWELKIWQFPEPCNLNSELLKFSPTDSCVTLEVTFPSTYPFVPPFIRIVSPPIQAGHVIMGGALFLDILLPSSCNYLGSTSAYSVSISLKELFTQITYSMVDGNAQVINKPELLDTYTYEKAHFVYSSILGLLTLDWSSIIGNVMGNNNNNYNTNYRGAIGCSNYPGTRDSWMSSYYEY